MELFINLFLLVIATIILVPCTILCLECVLALPFDPANPNPSPPESLNLAILIPAYNEASCIGATLSSLLPQISDAQQIVVVADNCTDDTAAIAQHYGVTVIERQDTQHRAKGYALDYGLQHLAVSPPKIVICVDADCEVEAGAIARLNQEALAKNKPIQALYLLEKPAYSTAKDLISALAFLVKNLVRPAGLACLGQPCWLTGTGMAFPWSVINQVSVASGNLVEDMQLGIDLALAGYSPQFCAEAKVISRLPQQESVVKTQRTRWEHGHLKTLLTQVPRLLQGAIAQRRFDLFFLALDLSIPPLSLLVLLWIMAMALTLLAAFAGVSWLPVIWLTIAGLFLLLGIGSAWAKFGRQTISGLALLSVPFYLLWKIPLYLTFIWQPQIEWVKTEHKN